MSGNETTQHEMRRMLAKRWRERDVYGVWFWGSWLLIRWNAIPILGLALGAVIGCILAGLVR